MKIENELELTDELWSTPFDEGEHIPSQPENYLFFTESGRVEFVIITEEIGQLNDFCMISLQGTLNKLSELK